VAGEEASKKRWREFEKLVARIEQTLGPRGAAVKSPDHIEDKFTREAREVDASVRFQIGTVPILITIECRDRAAVQDVTWIEQLLTKGDAVGAAKTIAVSSSGFTQPAIAMAKALGIEVRQVTEITDEDILRWFPIKEMETLLSRSGVVRVQLIPAGVDQPSELEFDRTVADLIRKDATRALIFTKMSDGKRLCLKDLVSSCLRQDPNFYFTDVPEDGSRVSRTAKIVIPPGTLSIQMSIGPCDISAVIITFELFVERSIVPISGLIEYSDASGALAYAGEATTEIIGNKVRYLVVHEPNTSVVKILVSRETPPGATPIEFRGGFLTPT